MSPITPLRSQDPLQDEAPQPRNRRALATAAGVALLATIASYVFWFIAILQVTGAWAEFQASSVAGMIYRGDFWDQARMLLALIGAGLLTLVGWLLSLGSVEE